MAAFDIEVINTDWSNDSKINELDLVGSIRDVPKLHSKWIGKLSLAKLQLRQRISKYNNLRQAKFRYYRGEMTKDELDKFGWTQWQGVKPLKTDMSEFLQTDPDLTLLEDKIHYMEVVVSTLEAIIRSINSRGYDLKTMLEAKKFYNGMN